MLKPIPKHQNYFLSKEKKLFGLSENGVIPIILEDDKNSGEIPLKDFFSKSGALYIHIQVITPSANTEEQPITTDLYFKQNADGVISSIQDLPTRPTISRVQCDNGEFTIKNFTWNEKLCSDVVNVAVSSGIDRFFMCDGYAYFPGFGMYLNVSDGRYNDTHMVRDKGLYYWKVNQMVPERITEPGEIW